VLFDECNVLRANRIILEKLRNIFMNMTDYMLVFAATDDFFPVMDEVFSPIMRQFKKIEIGPFKGYGDVRDCVYKPLINVGMSRPDAKRLVPRMFINDVDALSGRRPYEIQLICHTMFKRCQEGNAKKFSLDLVTIQTIQAELASGQNLEQRQIIKSARSLHRKTLSALAIVAATSKRLSAMDCWNIEYAFNGATRWTKENFDKAVSELLAANIIEERDQKIWFTGDDLDRIYIKYLARQKSVQLVGNEIPFEIFIVTLMSSMLNFDALDPVGAATTPDRLDDISMLTQILEIDGGPPEALSTISAAPWVEDLLAKILQMDPHRDVILYELFTECAGTPIQSWSFWLEPEQTAQIKKFHRAIDEFRERCLNVGFSMSWRSWTIKVPATSALATRIAALNNEQMATRLGRNLMRLVPREYVEEKNPVRAMELAKTAFTISPTRATPEANNVGYLYMAAGDFEEAKRWFQAGTQYNVDEDEQQLLQYNFGVLCALSGEVVEARRYFDNAKQCPIKSEAACTYELLIESGTLTYKEVFDPRSLDELADGALETIEQLSAEHPQ
jgi:tetratricopeptide (TPR) repeat protein